MRKEFIPVIILIWFVTSGIALAAFDGETEILALLQRQKEAWNRHDVEGFMAYYWNSENLTFQSGGNRLRGWKALRERYKNNYPPEKMGQLDFTDLEVTTLGSDHALVLGRWKLEMNGEKRDGVFTLVLRRFSEGWRIIHDHTS